MAAVLSLPLPAKPLHFCFNVPPDNKHERRRFTSGTVAAVLQHVAVSNDEDRDTAHDAICERGDSIDP